MAVAVSSQECSKNEVNIRFVAEIAAGIRAFERMLSLLLFVATSPVTASISRLSRFLRVMSIRAFSVSSLKVSLLTPLRKAGCLLQGI